MRRKRREAHDITEVDRHRGESLGNDRLPLEKPVGHRLGHQLVEQVLRLSLLLQIVDRPLLDQALQAVGVLLHAGDQSVQDGHKGVLSEHRKSWLIYEEGFLKTSSVGPNSFFTLRKERVRCDLKRLKNRLLIRRTSFTAIEHPISFCLAQYTFANKSIRFNSHFA